MRLDHLLSKDGQARIQEIYAERKVVGKKMSMTMSMKCKKIYCLILSGEQAAQRWNEVGRCRVNK